MAASFGAKTVKLPSESAAVKPSLATAAASAAHPFALHASSKEAALVWTETLFLLLAFLERDSRRVV